MASKVLLGLLATAGAALAANTCDTVKDTTSIQVNKRFSIDYTNEQQEYWSAACTNALKPSCILFPKSPAEVQAVVSILNTNNETFAVKSGGHNPNNYFASVDGGPLISTKHLNEVIFDKETETVRVGPGNRWEDVAKKLDGTGYSAVGGRIGNVGVGGYLLGGGLSFMSTEYGWAANSVVSYELVLANSTMITPPGHLPGAAGSGNAFGIVTAYVLKTYPQGDVWGGHYTFSATDENNKKLLAAVRDFTEYYPDEKAGVILTAETTVGGLLDIWILFVYYNGPEPPAGVFSNFTDVGPLLKDVKTQSYAKLLTGNNWAVLRGSVYTIGTETTPLPSQEHGAEIMGSYLESWRNVSSGVLPVTGLIASVAFQPMPKRLAAKARSMGGDLLDLDDAVDRIIFEYDYSYWIPSDTEKVDRAMQDTYTGLATRVAGFQGEGKLPADAYLPLFMNDGYFRQDYFGRLRPENAALARRVRDELDPQGLWATRTGGFKM
ncbi:FAD binding domain-containing protein [Apiospora kogelbergensis]|uniref:FAD binding domain-containing protein n=1 Tax=Apiospora kogelbergensis TaxID=1337665 RepID=UPI003131BC7F